MAKRSRETHRGENSITSLVSDLCHAFKVLATRKKIRRFLEDLLTPQELVDVAVRWQIARYLDDGLSYEVIRARAGASTTTIARTKMMAGKRFSSGGVADALKLTKQSPRNATGKGQKGARRRSNRH